MSRSNKDAFDIEDHYGAYLKKETIRTLSQPFILTSRSITINRKKRNVAIKRVERYKIKYRDFLEMNEMFKEYLKRLKGTMGVSNFVNKIYMAELTGAKVKISNRYGIIVEERANSIIVVFSDDTVKTYLKRVNDFVIEHEGIEYIFIGSKMKTNRFTKK